ncbi:MAG: DUF4386 domain-containing protein [Flavobacteriaceae bacterium]
MSSKKKTARIAGLIYLILILSGIFNLIYVPSTLFVSGDPLATLENIENQQTLFQLGILSGLLCFTCFILLPLALYKLLSEVHKTHAVLMVIFALVSVPISYLNIGNLFTVLSLINDEQLLGLFTREELLAQVMVYLEHYSNGTLVAHIFWGLWLFPFGYLVYKSGFLPKFLGICLMLGCFGYLIDFLGYFLCPDYASTTFATLVGIPSGIGEIGICLWMLIVGVRSKSPA